jgi:hypothetical protein
MSKTRILSKTMILKKDATPTAHKAASARHVGIVINGKTEAALRERARLLGISPEDLAKRIIDEYLKENSDDTIEPGDARFKKAAEDILRKHSDLYKRLTK